MFLKILFVRVELSFKLNLIGPQKYHILSYFQVDKAHPDVLTVMLQLFDEVHVLSLSTSLISVVKSDSYLQQHILNLVTGISWLSDGIFGGIEYPRVLGGLMHTRVSSQIGSLETQRWIERDHGPYFP